MRFPVPSLLGLYGVLSATAVSLVLGEGEGEVTGLETQDQPPHFLSVRPSLAKGYESEANIPTKKYFSKSNPILQSQRPSLDNGVQIQSFD